MDRASCNSTEWPVWVQVTVSGLKQVSVASCKDRLESCWKMKSQFENAAADEHDSSIFW